MDFLHNLAQTYYYTNSYSTYNEPTSADMWAFFAIFGVIWLFFVIGFGYILPSIFLMGLFKKAGVEAWRAWVPVYQYWVFMQLGGQHGAWSLALPGSIVLAFIPFIGWIFCLPASILFVVFASIAAYNIGLKLHKEGSWVVMFIFLQLVWMGVMAYDKSVWDDSLGKASCVPGMIPPTSAPEAPAK